MLQPLPRPLGVPMPTKGTITTNLRLPTLLHKKLVMKAEREHRSINGQIVYAIQQAVTDITDEEALAELEREQTS